MLCKFESDDPRARQGQTCDKNSREDVIACLTTYIHQVGEAIKQHGTNAMPGIQGRVDKASQELSKLQQQ